MKPMLLLPTSLRARVAVVTLLGIFLIPFATSTLRGLTHVLSCTDEVSATLSVDTTDDTNTVLLGADTVTREEAADPTLCGGLVVDLQISSSTTQRAEVEIRVTNETDVDWKGTLELQLGGTAIPVSIGRIDRGTTETDTVTLRVAPGRSYEISGTLLVGP